MSTAKWHVSTSRHWQYLMWIWWRSTCGQNLFLHALYVSVWVVLMKSNEYKWVAEMIISWSLKWQKADIQSECTSTGKHFVLESMLASAAQARLVFSIMKPLGYNFPKTHKTPLFCTTWVYKVKQMFHLFIRFFFYSFLLFSDKEFQTKRNNNDGIYLELFQHSGWKPCSSFGSY